MRNAAIVLALVIGGLLGLEWVMRQQAVQAALPQPERYLWHADNIQAKLDGLARLDQARGVDVLFLGNSTALSGLDPTTFDEARLHDTGPAAYNGALEGIPASAARTFAQVYTRRARPDMIIYAVTPQDLNPNSPTGRDVADRVRHSGMVAAATQDDAYGQLMHWLVDHSALFRYRPVLHALAVGGGQLAPLPGIYFDERGWVSDKKRLSEVPPADRARLLNKDGVWDYTPIGEQAVALAGMIADLKQQGIRLVLVNMPVSEGYLANFDHPEDYQHYLTELSQLSKVGDVPLWDMASPHEDVVFEEADFADLIHLNRFGAAKLSAALARRWQALESVQP